MPESSVCVELFLRWLTDTRGRQLNVQDATDSGAVAADGSGRLAIDVRPLIPSDNPAWLADRDKLEDQLSATVSAPIALWLPAGADLPAGEPDTSDFIDHIRKAATNLGSHERSHVPLPIHLLLRKSADSGNVVSVTGGLNPHWARFTERVSGTYDLDSTRLHRLPESDDHLEQLLDGIVERTKTLEIGNVARIETIDAWTVQRLSGSEPVAVAGIPAAAAQDMGLAVRRNLRRILAEAAPTLRDRPTNQRALVLLGHYPRIEQEGATTAMRGYDPTLYAGLDYVCLVADGLVKPLIQPP